MNLATILTVTASVVIVAVALLNGWVTNRNARRTASGSPATAPADVLFSTQADMLHTALAENAKLAERNDKLFEIIEQRTSLIQGILAVQKEDGELLARNLSLLERILSMLEGGGGGEPNLAPAPVATP